jgi:hypothetical protein
VRKRLTGEQVRPKVGPEGGVVLQGIVISILTLRRSEVQSENICYAPRDVLSFSLGESPGGRLLITFSSSNVGEIMSNVGVPVFGAGLLINLKWSIFSWNSL